MSSSTYVPDPARKPLPTVSEYGKPFWEGCRQHEVRVQHCDECGTQQFPPRALCAGCGSRKVRWKRIAGTGRVYSFTVIHRPPEPSFLPEVPYVVAVVAFDGGGRTMSNVIGCAPAEVRCEMRVEPHFEDVTDTVTLLKFRPAQ